jgi:GSH-dependent disulfide-bond oxidoreductase
MIDFYYSATPNGLKVALFLEEGEIAHRTIRVNLSNGDQFRPDFLAISPNNKIPAIVDDEPRGGGAALSVFESGAILLYLAEKHGLFLPADLHGRVEALQWLFWQVGGLGPIAGQIGHFNVYAPEKVPYAIERYTRETKRLYLVLEKRLADREFIAGPYSIADMACYPWIVPHRAQGQNLDDFPNLKRWFLAIGARPGVQRAYRGVEDVYARGGERLSAEARRTLFGAGEGAGSGEGDARAGG